MKTRRPTAILQFINKVENQKITDFDVVSDPKFTRVGKVEFDSDVTGNGN
jgi:hypothetical protein